VLVQSWIDDVRRWTGDDMNVARTNAMERLERY